MMRFSEREGHIAKRSMLQTESVDAPLRNRLWNIIELFVWQVAEQHENFYNSTKDSLLYPFFTLIWHEFFKLPMDEIPYETKDAVQFVRERFLNSEWHQVYSFIELIAEDKVKIVSVQNFENACNQVLEEEMAAFRFVQHQIVPITSKQEITAIEKAAKTSNQFAGVSAHIETAIRHFSTRPVPDYRNSIKESISAVESACVAVVGNPKATLSQALAILERKNRLHTRLKASFSALYDYTSDADGIRHALLEDGSELSDTDALFMLVSCSAFINYLVGKFSASQRDRINR